MNYSEALNLFGFTGGFTEGNLRKKYLELSKKYHPDKGGSDDMMKKINAAYNTLKGNATNFDLSYFNNLKEKLQRFVSKKVYEAGSAEEKCVNKINEIVNSLPLTSDKNVLNLAYSKILVKVDDVLTDYRKDIFCGIPDKFLKKYNKDMVGTIDEFFRKINNIKKEYDEIQKSLGDIIQSFEVNISANTLEKILDIKATILNDIIEDKINLQDGTNKFRCEIMTMIMQKEVLEKDLEEAYNALLVNFNTRMNELKFTDNEQIQTSLDIFKDALKKLQLVNENKLDKEVLSSLKTLDFTFKAENSKNNKNESQEYDNYEIFVTRNVYSNEPEFVLKISSDGKWIHYLRKYINDNQKTEVEEFITSENNFYEKYMRIDEFLDYATFFNKHYINGILALYIYYGTVIYITNDGAGTIKVGRTSDLDLKDEYSYYPYMYGSQYNQRNILKKKIYDDFKKYLDPKYKYNLDYSIQKDKFNVYNGKGR